VRTYDQHVRLFAHHLRGQIGRMPGDFFEDDLPAADAFDRRAVKPDGEASDLRALFR